MQSRKEFVKGSLEAVRSAVLKRLNRWATKKGWASMDRSARNSFKKYGDPLVHGRYKNYECLSFPNNKAD